MTAEVQTAVLWDGVEEPGELVWTHPLAEGLDPEVTARLRGYWAEFEARLLEWSGVGPQRRAWAVYARLEPWGA